MAAEESARDAAPALPAAGSPSISLVGNLRALLMRYPPFSEMQAAHVDLFVQHAEQAYFAPDELLLGPEQGPVRHLYFIRDGAVTGRRGVAEVTAAGIQYETGDLFPVGALMGQRAVSAQYCASRDTFCLLVPTAVVKDISERSPAFADFLNRRMLQFVEISRRAVQVAYASQTLAEQSLEARLGDVAGRKAISCTQDTPVFNALQRMHQQRLGSMLVVGPQEEVRGILTRYDVLGRITLPGVDLATPIGEVMTTPVHSLTVDDTAQDAALLMSRHGVRHVPVTDLDGRLISVVSERDLFALQRLSLKQVSTTIRAAPDVGALRVVSRDIRRFARNLLGQGVRSRQLTELISHLNDVLAERLVDLLAKQHGRNMSQACWVAFGSEGRSEQTISTDQDNGLVFLSAQPDEDRPGWLRFARDVNQALDDCGYPLCKGNIMASNPECCLTPDEWRARFARWIDHGAPEDLLKASIYFDLRALAGDSQLVQPLRTYIATQAAKVPRFLHQLAVNALNQTPPLTWMGGIDTRTVDGLETIDLKLQGTALYVDVARLYALAHGVAETNTRRRLRAMAAQVKAPDAEGEAWVEGFDFLQRLRLLRQMDAEGGRWPDRPNLVALDDLNDIDRRILLESFRVARRLQQRMQMDWVRGG